MNRLGWRTVLATNSRRRINSASQQGENQLETDFASRINSPASAPNEIARGAQNESRITCRTFSSLHSSIISPHVANAAFNSNSPRFKPHAPQSSCGNNKIVAEIIFPEPLLLRMDSLTFYRHMLQKRDEKSERAVSVCIANLFLNG